LGAATTLTLGGLVNNSGDSFSVYGSAGHQATLKITGVDGFTANSGSVALSYMAPLTLNNGFSNTGSFALGGNSALTVTGAFANSGTLTLDAGYGDGGGSLTIGGTLPNEIVTNGSTVHGTVQVGNNQNSLGAATTLTLGGLVNNSGDSFSVYGSAGHAATVSVDGSVNIAGTLNIGAYSVFDVTGGSFTQTGGTTTVSANGTFSASTINVDGGNFVVYATNFTNIGTLAAADGGVINLSAGGLTNLSGGTLTGGIYEVDAGSTLQLPNNSPIVTDDADIILRGAGSTIQDLDTTTNTEQSIDFTLRTISATGQLHLLSGRSLTTAAVFTNNGQLELGGGTLAVTGLGSSLTDGVGSRLYGFGVVNATTFTNSGLIEASGGTLTLTNAVTNGAGGTGDLQIDAGANLVLAATAASTNSVTFNGPGAELTLDHLGNLSGAIGGFGLDDTIALIGVTANGAGVNASDQLVVTENGTPVDTLQLNGPYSGFDFVTEPISGGTDIISLPVPATVADYLYVPSLYDLIPGGFAISDTLPNIIANLGALDRDTHISSLEATGGAATLSGGVTIDPPVFTLDKGTTLTVSENLTYPGSFTEYAGATVSVSKGDSFTLSGTASLSGKVSGKGTLALAGGSATISGTTFSDGGVLIENSESVTDGDAAGDVAKLTIASTGTWNILDNSGIGLGSSALSSITNAGLFEKTGGTGTSVIAPKIANNGVNTSTGGNPVNGGTLVSSGTLDFKAAVTGGTVATPGTDTISGTTTLEFDSTVATSKTVGSQDIQFSGSGGTLDLNKPTGFWGEISGFAPGDTIDILGNWGFSSFSENAGGTLGTLTLASGTTKHAFEFVGDFTPGSFHITPGATAVITHA
jgi:hypothetical protein